MFCTVCRNGPLAMNEWFGDVQLPVAVKLRAATVQTLAHRNKSTLAVFQFTQ